MRSLTFCTLLLLLSLAPLHAQRPGSGGSAATSGWGLEIGPRVGVELESSNWVAGGHLRVHLPWPGFVDVQGSSNWTFFDGLTERQINADVLFIVAGVALGGGPVWLNTIFETDDPRRTEVGWSGVVALGGNPGMGSWYAPTLEFRVSDVDRFSPRHFTVGIGLPIRF